MVTYTTGWRNRYVAEQLGTGYELSNLSRPQPAAHGRLEAIHARLGRQPAVEDLAYMLVDFLLPETINAAEGVERCYVAAHTSAAAAQHALEQTLADSPAMVMTPANRLGFAHPTVTAFWYDLINLITWARSLGDRVSRRGVRGDPDQGLLPSLAEGLLRDTIAGAYGQLTAGHLPEIRHLANYSLHGGIFQTPGTPDAEVVHRGLRFVMPDPIATLVDHWYEFTFRQKRDAVRYADEVFQQVRQFMDRLLDAFSAAVPDRFRRC